MTDASRSNSGMIFVLAGTIISAASSFLVLLIVAPALGPADYAKFSVFWGALFMVVAVLFGVQQESTRSVAARLSSKESVGLHTNSAATDTSRTVSVFTFAAVIAGVLLLIVSSTSPLWAVPLFGSGAATWGLPLAVAIAAYSLVAATNGVLAGTGRWKSFALLAVLDGVLRLVFVVIVLAAGLGNTALTWAVALPFPLSLAVVLSMNLRAVRKSARVIGSFSSLAGNTARTLSASLATAVLINGFPVFLSIFARSDEALLGAVILAVTLTRAPILVPLTALQSMLIARMSGDPGNRARTLCVALIALTGLTVLVAGGVWLWGAALIDFFFGQGFVLDPATLAGLVAASGCLGLLTATGAASLASSQHTHFAGGWIVAAVIALAVLAFVPVGLELRVVLALVAGPLIGAGWHLVALLRAKRSATFVR